jgi:hypothetical protein
VNDVHELPSAPWLHLRLDTGAIVPWPIGLWWEVDDFLEQRTSWVPSTSPPKAKRYGLPGARGYAG